MRIRHNWTLEELKKLYDLPLLDLISEAHHTHIQFYPPSEIQVCSLISVKTGGCPEDCKYCAQSSRYQTSISAQPMMTYEEVLHEAKKAVARGASRVCLGAAWREVRDNKPFDEIVKMIEGIANLGVEVCCTLGMLKPHQAKRLKDAGLHSYNHNIDTSENYYRTIITTRNFQDRLTTLDLVEKAAIGVCCGGILGVGETVEDRLEMLLTLCNRNPHPGSVPLNKLSAIPGTPLENQPELSFWDHLRIVAIARIAMPKTMVRLSSGRTSMSYEEHALCFLAGANSIHAGEKLLTVSNRPLDKDEEMFRLLGLKKKPPENHARRYGSILNPAETQAQVGS